MNYYPTYFITSATLDSGKAVLSVSGNMPLSNRSIARLLFAPGVAIPQGTDQASQVVLKIGENEYPLYGKFSQELTISEIPQSGDFFRARFPLVCGIAESGESFYLICWNLPRPTEYVIPL